jgi:hypothetical protein
MTSTQGYVGLLHPESIYDDPKGSTLREQVYERLAYHFQFRNQLMLFPDIGDRVEYGVHIYSGEKGNPNFHSIHNLFHPSTVEGCFIHNGKGLPGGIKRQDEDQNWVWNILSHKDRVVNFREEELRILAKTFEDSNEWRSAKLVSIHSQQIINVFNKLSAFPGKVKDVEFFVSEGWHETNAQDKGIIRRETKWADIYQYELIYSGPHFFVGNPFYKTPRSNCTEKAHYDEIDHTQIPVNFSPRTNYVPDEELDVYTKRVKGLNRDKLWINEYKVCFSKMLSVPGERTLQPSIIPPKVAHTNAVISTTFKDPNILIELAGLTSSIVLDFYVKSIGRGNLYDDTIKGFPLGVDEKYKNKLIVRILKLNSVSDQYVSLWKKGWKLDYNEDSWSRDDSRLPDFSNLTSEWSLSTPLRTHFERRQALVELDVIAAMALGLTLEELILIYEVQFPVKQQYEEDTWYDRKGNIVFTNSRGLSGVGTDRKTWNEISDLKEGKTYTHTVDPS